MLDASEFLSILLFSIIVAIADRYTGSVKDGILFRVHSTASNRNPTQTGLCKNNNKTINYKYGFRQSWT